MAIGRGWSCGDGDGGHKSRSNVSVAVVRCHNTSVDRMGLIYMHIYISFFFSFLIFLIPSCGKLLGGWEVGGGNSAIGIVQYCVMEEMKMHRR